MAAAAAAPSSCCDGGGGRVHQSSIARLAVKGGAQAVLEVSAWRRPSLLLLEHDHAPPRSVVVHDQPLARGIRPVAQEAERAELRDRPPLDVSHECSALEDDRTPERLANLLQAPRTATALGTATSRLARPTIRPEERAHVE